MAEFWTITQKGFNFICHNADKLVEDEEWSIERVAAFMAVHHTLTVMATKYAKGLTLKPKIACIQYTLKCDQETSADLDKLTKVLVPKLCEIYNAPDTQGYLGRPLNLVLDDVVKLAQDYIAKEQEPLEVFGETITPTPFFSRPSKLEYDALQEKEQKQEQAYWDKFKEALETGKAVHHKILIREGANTYTGIIIGVTARCVYVDLQDEYGRLLQHNARMPRNSPRFIIESFR
jgi:hypothetical protein